MNVRRYACFLTIFICSVTAYAFVSRWFGFRPVWKSPTLSRSQSGDKTSNWTSVFKNNTVKTPLYGQNSGKTGNWTSVFKNNTIKAPLYKQNSGKTSNWTSVFKNNTQTPWYGQDSGKTSNWTPALKNNKNVGQSPQAQQETLTSPLVIRHVVDTSRFSKRDGYEYLTRLLNNGKIDFDASGRYHLPTLWFSELDLDILNDPPLTDLEAVARPTTSLLHVTQVTGRKALRVGDHVTVRVDLRDSRGRPVHKGGHSVRVWMMCGNKTAAAEVEDLNNGSYRASLPVLWPGETTVFAALMRPREYRGIVLRILNKMKTFLLDTAHYTRNGTSQMTYCLSIPVIPGFPEVCNMTLLNYGLEWYCGKPSKKGLECSDWLETRAAEVPNRFSLSKPENDLFLPYLTSTYTFLLPQKYTFTATRGYLSINAPPCRKRAARDTWGDKSPRGFWDNGKWRPLKCSLSYVTSSFVDRCLWNTTVLLLGDSNARQLLGDLQRITKCTQKKEGTDHDPIHCLKPSSNARISWYPHGQPFYSLSSWNNRFTKHPPSYYLDSVPSRGSYIVLIHLYLHFAFVHTHTFGAHVREVARGVRDLLLRNPSVKVAIRGPHALIWDAAVYRKIHILGDYYGEACLRIFRQEFRDLVDRVFYLNVWDMTIANQNNDLHPGPIWEITKLFLGHVCPA